MFRQSFFNITRLCVLSASYYSRMWKFHQTVSLMVAPDLPTVEEWAVFMEKLPLLQKHVRKFTKIIRNNILIWNTYFFRHNSFYAWNKYHINSILKLNLCARVQQFTNSYLKLYKTDSSISTVTMLGDGQPQLYSIPFHSCFHTSSGAHLSSYPMDTGDTFHGSKVDEAWSWPLTSI